MSNFIPVQTTRGRLLASAAALTLVLSGAAGEAFLSGPTPAHAAAVDTSGLASPAPSFAALISRVKPAVVSIKVRLQNASWDESSGQAETVPPELRQFFKQFGEMPQLKSQPIIGQGSGFFISSDGFIVTNRHVVDDSKTATVTMSDGKVLTAKVVGVDPKTDLAVLKVQEKGDYPFVSFATQAPKVGDWVVAIGNPYGLANSATAGIVSAEGRDIGAGPYERFLQIDAPINKGNSGGPTFNAQGEVVGVNTAIISPSVGIGFAIPAASVEHVVGALEHGGVVTRGFLGVSTQAVTPVMTESLGLKQAGGAIVDKTEPNTPAAKAGLEPGDVITKVDGNRITDSADLARRIGALKPGDNADLSYMRDGAEKTASVTLGAMNQATTAQEQTAQNASDRSAHELLGVELAPANEVSGAGDKGVAIVNVDPDGAAAGRGLTDGDVILKVSGKSVESPEQVKQDIASAKHDGRKAVLFQVKTAQGDRFVAFAFPNA